MLPRRTRLIQTLTAALLLPLFFVSLPLGHATPVSSVESRSKAEDFSLENLQGRRVALSVYQGKVVVVNFWATWCAPCKRELPHLSKMYTALKEKGLVVLAVSMDDARTRSAVRPLVRRRRWKMPVLLDLQGRVVEQMNPQKRAPYTVFIDRAGRVASAHEGYHAGDEVQMRAVIEQLLAESAE
ncbi:MAG: TlpA disulfide reductase family protein [Myxococcota bacterium]|nr:TlpA disulfide reductase family protein [Myxococcota bacterium]